ncbi:putative protein [hydrothermal vent metagenome]|uniref:DUF302 domain-containing protein n=1 Tax=hydrothermal vent metagenome TaxID=652676 RepID=A0A1W1C2Y7_9ZZZZ
MIYKVETSKDIETVKSEIEAKAKAIGFGLLQTYDFKKILHDKGYPIEKEITVFELCNPSGAQQALTQIAEISAYLPCRISVYKEGGATKLATIGLEEIVNTVDVNPEFKSFMTILFLNLKQVMHSWDD